MPGRPQSSPGGVMMSERLCGAANPPTPGLQASPCAASPPLPACSGDCCSPPWLLYLFILHQQGCCRLILARFKRERGKKKKKEKCSLALLSTSVLAASGRSSNSSSARQAGRRAGGQAGSEAHGEVRAEGQLEWDGPPALDRCGAQLDATLRLLR